MDVSKLFIQDFPPTREEWYALKQSVRNWTLYALVDCNAIVVQYMQEQPYTAVDLAFDAGDGPGDDTFMGTGFSKVCWPDTFDAAEGERIARMRATRQIVKQLQDSSPGVGYDLGEAMDYDVLVAKWDCYQRAAKLHHLNAARVAQEAELDTENADVGVDLAEECDDEGMGTMLVHTTPPFIQMRN